MTFPKLVGVMTPALVCFHEAGHVATALAVGATVKRVELLPGSPPYAKTTVERTDPQAVFIACGGAAAEYYLFDTKHLVDGQGKTADAALFLSEARQNAAQDVKSFSDALTRLGSPPHSPIDDLIGTAGAKVRPRLNFTRVERIAEALLQNRVLDSDEIESLAGGRPPPWRAAYVLGRMNGQGLLRSLIAAFR